MVDEQHGQDTEIKRLEQAVRELAHSVAPAHEPPMVVECWKNRCFRISDYCSMTNFATCRYQSKALYVLGEQGIHKCFLL